MTEWAVTIASWAAILGGSYFLLVGAIGLIRMPMSSRACMQPASSTHSGRDCSSSA